jgi:sensor histidine kinase regulating citrate/malate metabolism
MSTESTPEIQPDVVSHEPRDWRRIGLMISIVAVLLLILYLAWQISSSKREATRIGAIRSATTLAAAVQPLMDLRMRDAGVTNQTLQDICQNIAASQQFDYVSIVNPDGVVIASTRLELLNRPMEGLKSPKDGFERESGGLWEVARPMSQGDVNFGAVVIRTN